VGALTLYSTSGPPLTRKQVELLLALAADVSYALDAIEAERLRGEPNGPCARARPSCATQTHARMNFSRCCPTSCANPLAPIKNSLYILAHARGDGEQAERAERVIGRQVTHLTDWSTICSTSPGSRAVKIRLDGSHLDLDEVVGRTVEDHRNLFARAGVKLALRPSGARLRVHADRTRLTQVVGNLLQNAAKFTPKGGTATVSVESRGGAQAAVRICDNGVGIGADILPHLFEPFTQADRTLDRSKAALAGTGFGQGFGGNARR